MDDDDIWGFDQLDRDNLMDMCSDDEYFDNYHQQMFGLQTVQPLIQVGGQLRGQYFYFHRIGMKHQLPVGAGPSNFSDYTKKLRSVIKIGEQDNLCLFRAVVVGMAYADMNEQPENKALKTKYNQIIDNRKSKQTNEAIKLCKMVIKNYSASAMYGIADIVKIEQVIENYQIRVIHVDEEYKQIQYGGDEKAKKINLVYYENHFEMIKSLPAFYNMKSFCEIFWTPYNCSFTKHKCNVVCKSCESRHYYESE
jgi:hypothetical protein